MSEKISKIIKASFEESENLQLNYMEDVKKDLSRWFLLSVEYQPLITLGRRLSQSPELEKWKIPKHDVVFTDRGGEATIHNPGQLVIYPIFHLPSYGFTVKSYVHQLEACLISLLESYGISGHRVCQRPGIFTDRGKIASIGIRVQRGISKHGLSLNVCNDLKNFKKISCCGVEQSTVDSMENYVSSLDLNLVNSKFQKILIEKIFNYEEINSQ
ncbi:MAG: lipoyl(octanoyl) transferase LipB [Bdellovibrionales bacterium]